jgi:hypothetical protein
VGNLVLVYPDALTVGENTQGQQLGEAKLLEMVNSIDPKDLAAFPAVLVAALDGFRGGRPTADDLAFLLLHPNAGPSRPPGLREPLNGYAKVLGLKSVESNRGRASREPSDRPPNPPILRFFLATYFVWIAFKMSFGSARSP